MAADLQKKAFLEYEADKWFSRNKEVLMQYDPGQDKIISLLKNYALSPANVLEIGCSAGYRLDGIRQQFPGAEVFGVEPSQDAVSYGSEHYPGVHFHKGTADDMHFFADGSMDIIIVGFVFYVIDRRLLMRSMAEIDRVLKDKGTLIIMDFFTEAAVKRAYTHISDFSAYTFKENYDEVFTATHLYHLIDRSCYHHEKGKMELNDFQSLYSISLLKKDLHASYK